MNNILREDEKTELGIIKIHNDVIASIAYLATQEVDGISRICDDMKSKILSAIGKKTKCAAIGVKSDKSDGISITIPIIVKYGCNIPEIALKVQERVKAIIEETTDLSPKDIIIKIKGVER